MKNDSHTCPHDRNLRSLMDSVNMYIFFAGHLFLNMSSQNDLQTERFSGQMVILARHWPLTSLRWEQKMGARPGPWGPFEAQPCEYNVLHLNPLGPKTDQHQFSPNNISRSSRVRIMRITKLMCSCNTHLHPPTCPSVVSLLLISLGRGSGPLQGGTSWLAAGFLFVFLNRLPWLWLRDIVFSAGTIFGEPGGDC